MRTLHFFWCNGCSVHNRVNLGEMPPCLVPWKVWQIMWKIPPKAALFLCREIDFEIMEEVSNKLPRGNKQWQELLRRATDGIPRESS